MAHKPTHGGGGGGGGKPPKDDKPPKGGGGKGKPPPIAPAIGGGFALQRIRPRSRFITRGQKFGVRRRRSSGTLLGGGTGAGALAPRSFGFKSILGG